MTTAIRTYLGDVDIEAFDYQEYVRSRLPANYSALTPQLKREARVLATRNDPLLFGILYFSKTLTAGGEGMTFADMHIDLCRIARRFRDPLDPVNPLRFAFIAPRRAGKTSWLYKIILFWMAAHKHRTFFHVVTGTGRQAQLWMTNFKRVIDQNTLMQADFTDLCTPMVREATGRAFSDGANLYVAASGFILGTQGSDGNSLGLNVDDERPDFILFDDIEPPGGSYSLIEMNKRLTNVLEGAIPMGQQGCSIIFVGTVLMPGSIMDQFRVYAERPDPKSWIAEEQIVVRWYKPFVDRITGEQTIAASPNSRSFWPGRHPTERLMANQHTRTFAIQYANKPKPENGAFWIESSFPEKQTLPDNIPTITAMSMDPAVTTKKSSDFTAISIIRYAPSIGKFEVLYGRAFKLSPGVAMPQKVAELLGYFPEITVLYVEQNQGGDLWAAHYGDIPGVRYRPIRNNSNDGNKSHRAAAVLRLYETGHVFHSSEPGANTIELEDEMIYFPNGLHDDLPDSLCFGVLNLLRDYGRTQPVDREERYV